MSEVETPDPSMNEPPSRNGGAPSASPPADTADADPEKVSETPASGAESGSGAAASVSRLRSLAKNIQGSAERSPFLLLIGFGDERAGSEVEREILAPRNGSNGDEVGGRSAIAEEPVEKD